MADKKLQKIQYFVGTTTITILVGAGNVLARGVAICSYKDNFDINKGAGLSYQRALNALKLSESSEAITPKNTFDDILKVKYSSLLSDGYKYFSEFKPDDLPVEMQFLGKIPNFEYRLP